MRIAQLNKDWKEKWDFKLITKTAKKIGGEKCIYNFDMTGADSDVIFISSEKLSPKQLQKLWDECDFHTGEEVWEGKTLTEIIKKIQAYIKTEYSDEEE